MARSAEDQAIFEAAVRGALTDVEKRGTWLRLYRDEADLLLDALRVRKNLLEKQAEIGDELCEINEQYERASANGDDFEVFERIDRERGRAEARLALVRDVLYSGGMEEANG